MTPAEDKPKRRRGRPPGTTEKFKKAREIIRPFIEAGQSVNTHELAQQYPGIAHDTFDRAVLVELARTEAIVETRKITVETRKITTEDVVITAGLTEKGKLKLDDAIRVHKTRLDKQFEQRVNEEVRRRLEVAADATRAENKRLRLENINLTSLLTRRKTMTEPEFMALLSCLHPDSRNSVSPERLHRAFQILQPKKYALTGEK